MYLGILHGREKRVGTAKALRTAAEMAKTWTKFSSREIKHSIKYMRKTIQATDLRKMSDAMRRVNKSSDCIKFQTNRGMASAPILVFRHIAFRVD